VHVTAFSSPPSLDWRWRIAGADGELLAQSDHIFPTISAAVAHGTQRLIEMNAVNRREPDHRYRWSHHRRLRDHA
jgi:hypothetical protein